MVYLKTISRIPLPFLSLLAMVFMFSLTLLGQQPSRRASSVLDLFNQEAGASDPVGIHKYSKNLIELVVPDEGRVSDIDALANRLARAEQMARERKGRLVPEGAVVRAFNELMEVAGAPPSLRTDEASMRKFRVHGASIKAFPSLLSADRNGTNCNPGEAVFLLYLLISNNGVLSEQDLDGAQALTKMDSQKIERSLGVAHMTVLGSNASRLISSYALHHDSNTTIALFTHVADVLGL